MRSCEIDIVENVIGKVFQKRAVDKTSGQLVINTLTVHARKHALRALRVKVLNKYKKVMRLNPDSYFEIISKEELIKGFRYIGESIHFTENLGDLKERLKHFERTMRLQVSHDGSCITKYGLLHII